MPTKPKSSSPNDRIDLGRRAENLAASYFECLGFSVRQRNLRTTRGELDLLVEGKKVLVFVEVRARSRRDEFCPTDSIGQKKRQKVRQVVQQLLDDFDLPKLSVRIDVVGITFSSHGALIEHHRGAI